MKTPFSIACLCLGLGAADVGVDADTNETEVVLTPAYLARLSEELRTNHPALKAGAARVEAAIAATGSVRTWKDPSLFVGAMFAEREMRAEDGDLIYGIRQELPLFGLPGLERDVAKAEEDVENTNFDAQFQFLRRDLAMAAFRAALTRETLEIDRDDLTWVGNMVQSARQRYEAGQGSLTELLRLQNEEAERRNRIATGAQVLGHDESTLNRMLGRAELAPWPALRLPAAAGPVPYNDRVVRLGLANEPRLRVSRAESRQKEAAARWTRRQRLPEIGVVLDGRNYTGTGEFRQGAAMLEFSVPWGNSGRYRKDYERDLARARASGHDTARLELEVREELHMLTVETDVARRDALLYRDEVLPRSENALKAAEAAWAANRGSFYDVMEARRMLLDARGDYAEAIVRQYTWLTELVLCCGLGDLEALSMIAAEPENPDPGARRNP
jgi:cobalt-zinc-cadmium efflux system outer membrane protein